MRGKVNIKWSHSFVIYIETKWGNRTISSDNKPSDSGYKTEIINIIIGGDLRYGGRDRLDVIPGLVRRIFGTLMVKIRFVHWQLTLF